MKTLDTDCLHEDKKTVKILRLKSGEGVYLKGAFRELTVHVCFELTILNYDVYMLSSCNLIGNARFLTLC